MSDRPTTPHAHLSAECPANRRALVTGASGGIGAAIARALAAEGAAVALAYNSSGERATRLAAQLSDEGTATVAIAADLRAPEEPARLTGAAEAAIGPLDVLVCAAGAAPLQSLEEVSAEDFDATLAVNLRAPFLLAQRVLPGMSERRFGRILFISSVAALTGGIVGPHYAASKAGLHALTHYLAARFAADGVTVNALAPALITDTIMLPGEPEVLKQRIPVGRLGRPEEVADLALAVLRNAYLTNKVLVIDGGILAR